MRVLELKPLSNLTELSVSSWSLLSWDTRDGDEILTSLNYPWDRCDPVWRSGKVLGRTSTGLGFNSPTGPDFFTIYIQCVFVSQCSIINLINHFTGLYIIYSDPRTHCLVFRIAYALLKWSFFGLKRYIVCIHYLLEKRKPRFKCKSLGHDRKICTNVVFNFNYQCFIFKMIPKLVAYGYRWQNMTCLKEFYQMSLCTKKKKQQQQNKTKPKNQNKNKSQYLSYFINNAFQHDHRYFKHMPLPWPSFPETHNKSWLVVLLMHPCQVWFFHVDRLCLLAVSYTVSRRCLEHFALEIPPKKK